MGPKRDDEDMRERAEWMVPSDDPILELIQEYGNLTPAAIERLGGPVSNHASERCQELTKHGLLVKLSRGLYRLTDEGEAYLEGELDASTLPDEIDEEERWFSPD